jgi:hypothetical protein
MIALASEVVGKQENRFPLKLGGVFGFKWRGTHVSASWAVGQ